MPRSGNEDVPEFKGILIMVDFDKQTVARNTTTGKEPAGAGCYSCRRERMAYGLWQERVRDWSFLISFLCYTPSAISSSLLGKRIVNLVPFPSSLSTAMEP